MPYQGQHGDNAFPPSKLTGGHAESCALSCRLATDAYANAMQQRANDIHQNLGLLESAWDSLGKTAKGAWDAMLNIGREQTLTDKLSTLNENIAEAQKGQKDGGFWNSFSARFTGQGQ